MVWLGSPHKPGFLPGAAYVQESLNDLI